MNKKIRALLLMKDITCAELAREVGVSRTWVSLVVNGHKKSNRIRKVIAHRLSKKVEDLWPSNGNGDRPRTPFFKGDNTHLNPLSRGESERS